MNYLVQDASEMQKC